MKERLKNTSENMRLNNTGSKILVNSLFFYFKYIFCIYKMYLISVEGYENAGVHMLMIKKLVQV